MKPLGFAPAAVDDLNTIFLRIARDKPDVAIRFVDRVEEQCRLLPRFPELGSKQDDLAIGLRVFSYRGYGIYYRELDAEIRIERVLAPGLNVTPEFFSLPD